MRLFRESSGRLVNEWLQHLSLLGSVLTDSDTGFVGLRAGPDALAIIPPFPLKENRLVSLWEPTPLLELLTEERTVGVVLLRLGRYSVGLYEGGQLVSSKTDSRYVKGRHRAGGSSARRFQRIREGQIRKIYDDVCEVVRDQFEPHARRLDYIVLGGEHLTLIGFRKVCPYLDQFQHIILDRRLNIRDPKRDTLESVADMLLESRVYQFSW